MPADSTHQTAPAATAESVIAEALGRTTTGMSGGEPFTEAYRPEGLALIVLDALSKAGYAVRPPTQPKDAVNAAAELLMENGWELTRPDSTRWIRTGPHPETQG